MAVTSDPSLLSQSAPTPSSEGMAPPASPLHEGQIIGGRYRVGRLLGEGGMGLVFEGQHVELGNSVAIKVVSPRHLTDTSITARFVDEARSVAALDSPYIARVFDAGQLDSGEAFMIMERLIGRSLLTHLQQEGALTYDLAALYALQACEGLAEAHAHGLIHRDLKPEHLFIVEVAGTSPFVKLLDFGISKHITGSIRGAVTNPGDSIGSPCYMSPEQMQDPSTVDVRTDVWSLGTVLYEALAATKAFDADSLMQLQWQIMGESPTSLAELCPSVPAPLEAIVMRCLEKDREQRFLTIAEVGDALRAFLTQYGRERTDTDVYVDALPGAEAVASGAHPSGFVAGEVLPSRSAAPTVRQRAPVADADARAPAKDISGADDEPSAAGVPRRSRHPVVRALILVGVSLGVVTILGLWALGGTDGISALTLGLSVDADRPQDTSVMKQQRSSVPSMHTLEQKPPTGEVLRPATEATTPTPNPSQPAASQAVVSQPRTKPTEASAERRGASPTSIEEALTPAEKDARYRSWLRSQRMTPVEEVAMPDEGSTD